MEHEITSHLRKIYRAMTFSSASFWHKFREVVTEILIIVFAVSLAAFLERRREHDHDQQEAKQFLLGLKTDLRNDLREMAEDTVSYYNMSKAFDYLSVLLPGQLAAPDSLQRYKRYLYNTTGLVANSGRYEGFKSSGHLNTIENLRLRNDILDLYQETIPTLLTSTNAYSSRKGTLSDHVTDYLRLDATSKTNLREVLAMPKAQNISRTLGGTFVQEVLSRYRAAMTKSAEIIQQIDKEYPEAAAH